MRTRRIRYQILESSQNENASSNAGLSSCSLTDSIKQTTGHLQRNYRRILQIVPQVTNEIDQEWQRLTRYINYLEAELDECRTQIFKYLPTDGISDTCIREKYSLLRDSLSNWVEGFPEIDSFTSEMEEYDMRIRASPALFPEGLAAAQLEILTLITSGNLWLSIFTVPVFGAPQSDLALLQGLYHGMHLLEPEKDSDAINSWRSDTLRAYTSHRRFEYQFRMSCLQVTSDIRTTLDEFSFVEPVDWARKSDRFMEQIAKPAAELAVKMSCSPERYYWNWYDDSEWYTRGVVSKRDMSNFTIMDVSTHQNIRTAKFRDLPDDAKIGDLLLVMYPALFRCGKKGDKKTQIEKAIILIRVTVDAVTNRRSTLSESSGTEKGETKNKGAVDELSWASYLFE